MVKMKATAKSDLSNNMPKSERSLKKAHGSGRNNRASGKNIKEEMMKENHRQVPLAS